jgi:hypothetical protein
VLEFGLTKEKQMSELLKTILMVGDRGQTLKFFSNKTMLFIDVMGVKNGMPFIERQAILLMELNQSKDQDLIVRHRIEVASNILRDRMP